jgi:hypothetical protein
MDREVRLGEFGHLRFDRGEIVGRKCPFEREIVVEAVFDDRADRDLRLGEQRFHRLGQQVCGGMADDLEALRIARRDQRERGVALHHGRGVHEPAVDPGRECGAGETGTDVGSDVGGGDRVVVLALAAVWQGDDGHGLGFSNGWVVNGKERPSSMLRSGDHGQPGNGQSLSPYGALIAVPAPRSCGSTARPPDMDRGESRC